MPLGCNSVCHFALPREMSLGRIDQVKDALRAIFDTVDADHNGKIDKAEAKDLMDKFRGHADARFEESMVNNRVVNVIFRNLDIDGSGGVDFDECWLAFRQAMPEDLEAQIDSMSARSFVDALDHLEALNLAIQGNDFSGIDVNDMMEELEGYADELEQ